jgi:hypothetical protein
MKKYFLPLAAAIILTAGCVHHTPLSTEHTIAIDYDLLGLWEAVPGEAKGDPTEDMMLILPWSETEYVAQFPRGEKGDFYRAYPVEIGGRLLIQAQSLGSSWGDLHEGDRVVYPILEYRIVEGILMISTLNIKVVDEHLGSSEALSEAILANLNRNDLFEAPAHFRRSGQ